MAAPSSHVVGLDIGSQKSVVAVADRADLGSATLVTNDLSNRQTPTLVSFAGKERFVGETAEGQLTINPTRTITDVTRFLGRSHEELPQALGDDLPHLRFSLVPCQLQGREGEAAVLIDYSGEDLEVLPEHVLGMLIKQFKGFADKAVGGDQELAIAVPPHYTSRQHRAIISAAAIMGITKVRLVSSLAAAALSYGNKHFPASSASPASGEGESKAEGEESNKEERVVMIIDMGHSATSLGLARYGPKGTGSGQVINSVSDHLLGAHSFDLRLFSHFAGLIENKHKISSPPGTKRAQRLVLQSERVKKVLSTVNDAVLELDCYFEDTDVHFEVTKEKFEAMCAPEKEKLQTLIRSLLESASLSPADVHSVELIGGGIRIPFVQSAIKEVMGDKLSFTLDSSSCIAVGAALLGAYDTSSSSSTPSSKPVPFVISDAFIPLPAEIAEISSAELQRLVELEARMTANDLEAAQAAEARNALESFVYTIRDASTSSKYAALFPKEEVASILNAAEDWWLDNGAEEGLAAYQAKLKEVEDSVRSLAPGYWEKLEQEKREANERIEEAARKAAEEKALNGGNEDDHDFRKLKKEDRMRLVVKNKEEGNELFKGGNIEMAIKRYTKAVLHSEKFFDLSPEDEKEVKSMRLSLFLNLAQCWLKIDKEEGSKKTVEYCTKALQVDENSVKALYRRAVAYEKLKEMDKSYEDLKLAASVEPGDELIKKAWERIQLWKKKQTEKEKQMYSRMFA